MSEYTDFLKDAEEWQKKQPILKLSIPRAEDSIEVEILPDGNVKVTAEGSFWIESLEDLRVRFELASGEDVWYCTGELCIELFVLSAVEAKDILNWVNEIAS